MPEYLSPGVKIEEVPPRIRGIEGVSTSTAGFVGPCRRGPVPGYDPPNSSTSAGLDPIPVPQDPAPRMVTSYPQFVRLFGEPLPMPDPNENGYLARAVKAFFDNGGSRCYIARCVNGATRTTHQVQQGTVLHLTRRASNGDTVLHLNTLRGIDDSSTIQFLNRSDGSNAASAVTVQSYDTNASTVDLGAPGVDADLDPNQVYAFSPATPAPLSGGAMFHARSPGSWSRALRIRIEPADKGPVSIQDSFSDTGNSIRVASAGSFYAGAIVEIDTGAARVYNEVADIQSGNVLLLENIIGAGSAAGEQWFARVLEIDVIVEDPTGSEPVLEAFRGLTWNPRNDEVTRRRYYGTVINNRSTLVYVIPPPFQSAAGTEDASLARQPTTPDGFAVSPAATNVGNDAFGAIVNADYIGENNGPGSRTGLASLEDVDEISLVAVPGRTAREVQDALITQCENLRYRFAVLDGQRDPAGGAVSAILAHRNPYDSSRAAYYQPWVQVIERGQRLLLPPSPYVAGIMARVDAARGVHKAPANELVRGIVGLRSYVTEGEQDVLNPRSVNVIREFQGRGTRVWGGRTLSSDSSLRYVSVARYLRFLEKSLDRGTQWVVWEPNHFETWSRVVDSVRAFLHTQWRDGALFGRRPEDAFEVRCDESTMTADDLENGRLICLIGVSIVRPAEFVIFRIEQISALASAA